MKPPKSILFIITSLYGGGAEKVCSILSTALSEKYDVTVAYLCETEKQYPFGAQCELIKIPEYQSKWKWIGTLLRLIRRGLFVRRLKKGRKIDVSVSFLIPANQINIVSRCGERIITSERANPLKYLPEKFWRTRIIYALSDYVVFQSEKVRGLYGKRVLEHSGIIQNPVHVPCKALDERHRRIVTMGRLTDQKNHEMLIRSFSDFLKDYPDYTLSIYGEGELQISLEQLIEELNLRGSVFLEGNVQDVHRQIADAEIFVLSSNYEGMSNALLECMIMGIACISTACEGSTDVIRDGENGLLIEIGDQQGLTQAMKRLAQDTALRKRIERNGAEEADKYSIDTVLRKWEDILF